MRVRLRRGVKVVFFGSDDVSLSTLVQLHRSMRGEGAYPGVVGELKVVCPGERRGHRRKLQRLPVHEYSDEHGLEVATVPRSCKTLREWEAPFGIGEADVGVVVSFGYLLWPHLLEMASEGSLNMHPSLLPKYRGPAPIPRSILSGDAVTGVSIINVDRDRIDAGNVLAQQHVVLRHGDTESSLRESLSRLGAEMVLHTLSGLGGAPRPAPQDESLATYAGKLTRQDSQVDWSAGLARVLRQYYALERTVGIETYLEPSGLRVKLLELQPCQSGWSSDPTLSSVVESHAGPVPGLLVYSRPRKALYVWCGDGSWVEILRVQCHGKKPTDAISFVNGYSLMDNEHRFSCPT